MTHPLFERGNPVKEATARGELTRGIFFLSGSPMVVEACSTLPLDWVLVDAEASPVNPETILHLFQALTGSGVAPFVRAPQLDQHIIEHLLDLGAMGVLVPKISTAAMAEAVV